MLVDYLLQVCAMLLQMQENMQAGKEKNIPGSVNRSKTIQHWRAG